VHYGVHIELLSAIDRLASVLEHDTAGQVHVLVGLDRASFAEWAHKTSW